MKSISYRHLLLFGLCLCTLWSWIGATDRITWWMETIPGFIGLAVLLKTRNSFTLSSFLYTVIFCHICILLIGGHYTYALAPPGEWLKSLLDTNRNHFDRLGHFFQGFTPALVTREIVIRKHIVRSTGWMLFFVFCTCLAISAFYELLEWVAALVLGQGADAFLGTQGDPWDTQEDMATAALGALSALLIGTVVNTRRLTMQDLTVWKNSAQS